MSRKSFKAVEKAFATEVANAFGFLTSEFGLDGPEHDSFVLQTVTYSGPGVRYQVMLNHGEMAVSTRVEMDTDTAELVAKLGELVQAAGLGKRQHVPKSAHTLYTLQKTLQGQADFVRRIHPLMTRPTAVDMMRRADAREWRNR